MINKNYIEHLKKDDLTVNECIEILHNLLNTVDSYYYDIAVDEVEAIERKLRSGYYK